MASNRLIWLNGCSMTHLAASAQPVAKAQKTDAAALKTQKELVKEKFKMAIDQIRRRIVKDQGINPSGENFKRILEELNMVLLKILLNFGQKFGPSCDVHKKYSLAYTKTDEKKMMDDVFQKIGIERKSAGKIIGLFIIDVFFTFRGKSAFTLSRVFNI